MTANKKSRGTKIALNGSFFYDYAPPMPCWLFFVLRLFFLPCYFLLILILTIKLITLTTRFAISKILNISFFIRRIYNRFIPFRGRSFRPSFLALVVFVLDSNDQANDIHYQARKGYYCIFVHSIFFWFSCFPLPLHSYNVTSTLYYADSLESERHKKLPNTDGLFLSRLRASASFSCRSF